MFAELETGRADGRYPHLFRALTKANLLILDDWGPDRNPSLRKERRVRSGVFAIGWLSSWPVHKLPMVLSDTIDRLIGLGHGLTPSGDDFLGGAMIGLQLVGRSDLSKLLFENVEGKVALRSNAISAAHLAAAAEGAGGEWLHGALNGILTGDVELLPTALTNVGRMGHTSGLDALAGAITVFREWLACEPVGHCQLSWQLSPSSAHSSFIRSSPSRV